ncbi:hypothetical protein ACA086_06600 [Muriicola sp. E247]|uniref:hypothetical protein n=1 Tax=Muriicola sp. E247 TaxID=3242730 RepID=UPI003523A904
MEEEGVAYDDIGLDVLHQESREWISQLDFTADEIGFFDHLLHSYVFEPDTPALFETLQGHQKDMVVSKKKCKVLRQALQEHENKMSGLLEISSDTLDAAYKKQHMTLKHQMEGCMAHFQDLKANIFSYGQKVLKKRHRKDR